MGRYSHMKQISVPIFVVQLGLFWIQNGRVMDTALSLLGEEYEQVSVTSALYVSSRGQPQVAHH